MLIQHALVHHSQMLRIGVLWGQSTKHDLPSAWSSAWGLGGSKSKYFFWLNGQTPSPAICGFKNAIMTFLLLFYSTPFFLLKYSPILAVETLPRSCCCRSMLHNTPPGYFICYFTFTKSKMIFKHIPQLLRSYWFFSPIPPIHISISKHIPCS